MIALAFAHLVKFLEQCFLPEFNSSVHRNSMLTALASSIENVIERGWRYSTRLLCLTPKGVCWTKCSLSPQSVHGPLVLCVLPGWPGVLLTFFIFLHVLPSEVAYRLSLSDPCRIVTLQLFHSDASLVWSRPVITGNVYQKFYTQFGPLDSKFPATEVDDVNCLRIAIVYCKGVL